MTAHVLLVEDVPKLAQFVEAELSLEGYRVTVAANGRVGKQYSRSTSVSNSSKHQPRANKTTENQEPGRNKGTQYSAYHYQYNVGLKTPGIFWARR